jgi:hypothetical protein
VLEDIHLTIDQQMQRQTRRSHIEAAAIVLKKEYWI